MSWRYTVDSLMCIALKNICNEVHVHVSKSRDVIERLPMNLKELILQRVTRTPSFLLFNLEPKEIFSLLVHKNIRTLDLSYVKVDDDLLELFEMCTELREIRFSGSEHCYPSPAGLCKFLQNKKKLHILNLSYCGTATTDDVIKVVVDNCPDLNGLIVRGCQLVTDVSMQYLSTMNNLKWLDLTGTMLTDGGIATLTQGNSSKKLLELRIAYCPQITYHVLAVVIANCPELEIFEFHNCCPAAAEYQRQMQALALEATEMKRLKQLTFTVSW